MTIHEKESFREALGNNIRALRTERSMSLEDLAGQVGMTPGFLGFVERGKRGITFPTLKTLSEIFGVSPDDLIKPFHTGLPE